MHRLLQKLTGGDRRSIGNVAGVIHDVSKRPALFEVLFDGLAVDDPLIRMRAADAIEKISADQPALLRPFKKEIIRRAGESRQQEVRWHMAQIIVRPAWTTREKDQVVEILFDYLDDNSKIVVTFALQALSDFAAQDKKLQPRVVEVLKELTATGSPAIKNRGRKLLEKLAAP
jgi:HEAT repeat protein